MIKLGLTGSIGMGKSTTAAMFREAGIPVYDADKTVHNLYEDEAVAVLAKDFPSAIVANKIDRKILGSLVLGNVEKLKFLESLIHPLVHKKQAEFIQRAKDENQSLVVLDIPLLFETGGEKRVDKIVVVTADADIQRERVLSRPEMSEEKFIAILNRQTSDEIKRENADFLIDTGEGMEHARDQVADIISSLQNQ